MNNQNPVITIITVTFQAADTLRATIESVLEQEPIYEYIIIDGGSTDGTIDIIRKYEANISYWVSERDEGIYNAMNKGILQAKGCWLYFLGADDILLPNILSRIHSHLSNKYALLFGNVLVEGRGEVVSFMSERILLQNTVHHQGAFYSKQLFNHFLYNTKLRILSDYELNLKIHIENLPIYKLSEVIAFCGTGGASSNFSISLKETNIIRKKYISSDIVNIFLSSVLRIYYLQKRIRNFLFRKHKRIMF